MINAYVCFESNLTKVSHNSWWIDYDCKTHVSNMMEGSITIQTINQNEKFVYMSNKMNFLVEGVRIY